MSDEKVLPNLWVFKDAIEIASDKGHAKTTIMLRKTPYDELYIPADRIRALIEKQKRERWSYDTLIRNLEALIEGGE